eukprot:scaffold91676_cov19-Tisochrysis_lutea.AAC.2
MSEEQACSVQLVLTFLRNLLYVPEVQVNRSEWRSNYLQEALYKNLFESDVMELLMVVSQHAGRSGAGVLLCVRPSQAQHAAL